ncbi:hypothetical protein ACN28S_59015 [Cystobacter fuscus]
MQGVVVIGSSGDEWKRIRTKPMPGVTARYDMGDCRHVLEFPDGYIAFNLEPELANEYEDGELSGLPFRLPVLVAVEYNAPSVLRRVVLEGLFGADAWIDDDNHPPMPLAAFRERLGADPLWDWRS